MIRRDSFGALHVIGASYAVFIGVACCVLEASQTGASRAFTVVVEFVYVLFSQTSVFIAGLDPLRYYAPLQVHSWRIFLALEILEKCYSVSKT
jgi:hypothetical protein